jgi:carboxymethylenebutenolidase
MKIPAAGGEMPVYVAMPAGGGPFPVVLVVQEIFGVHEYIKDTCRRFAKAGFMAIAAELFARQGDPSKYTMQQIPDLVKDIVSKVPDAQVMADLDACVAWAEKSGKAKAGAVGVTGFCWGGRIVWLYAAHSAKLKAGVAWYGRIVGQANPLQPKNPLDIVADLKAPVLGLYGKADQGIPNDTVEMMQAELKKHNKKGEIVMYDGAPHGFHADFRGTYREGPAKDGWTKALAWFKANGVA